MAENSIEKKTKELLEKIILDLGYELYDIEYAKEGKEADIELCFADFGDLCFVDSWYIWVCEVITGGSNR